MLYETAKSYLHSRPRGEFEFADLELISVQDVFRETSLIRKSCHNIVFLCYSEEIVSQFSSL